MSLPPFFPPSRPFCLSFFLKIPENIIGLIDPDFLFLKPLTPFLDPKETVVRGDGLSLEGLKLEKGGWVREGHPSGVLTDLSK